jgi:dihydrofolate reductase
MRKLIYAFNLTLDGCSQHDRQFVDAEMLDFYTQSLETADLFVYGRKTYQLMVPYWPDVLKEPSASKADTDFARAFVSKKRVVFSRTLASADDAETRIARGGLREEILKLKQEPGKDILTGGVDIPSQLVELGLIDEFRFVIGPIIAGKGRRLFDNVSLPEGVRLKLIDTKVLKSGCVALHYAK